MHKYANKYKKTTHIRSYTEPKTIIQKNTLKLVHM